MVRIKRVYEPAEEADGQRVLVERLWPRGVSKQKAKVDVWLKEIAPSAGLRRWFGHDPEKWTEFGKRYRAELKANGEAVGELKRLMRQGRVTLVYAARDEAHNSAVVLQAFLGKG